MGFGSWLTRQKDRTDWIGDLARGAASDARFPWAGSPVEMQDRLRATVRGEGDMLQAFEAALEEWHGGPYPLHLDRAARDTQMLDRAHDRFRAQMEAEVERQRLARNARDRDRRRR